MNDEKIMDDRKKVWVDIREIENMVNNNLQSPKQQDCENILMSFRRLDTKKIGFRGWLKIAPCWSDTKHRGIDWVNTVECRIQVENFGSRVKKNVQDSSSRDESEITGL